MAVDRENIKAIHFEAQHFIEAFAKFRSKTKRIDASLCASLSKVIADIDSFLNSKPAAMLEHSDKITMQELNTCGIERGFHCTRCWEQLGNNLEDVTRHMVSPCNADRINNICGGKHARPAVFYPPDSPITSSTSTDSDRAFASSTSPDSDRPRGEQNNKRKVKSIANAYPRIKSRYPLIPANLPQPAKNLLMYNFKNFFKDNVPTAMKLMNIPVYTSIEESLTALITPHYPKESVKVHIFGSRIAGAANVHSDLDIFIDIGNVFNQFTDRGSQETLDKLQKVKKILTASKSWSDITAIKGARVPIIKATYGAHGGLRCDICFSNGLGYCNTMMVQYLLNLQPVARFMCLFLKQFMERAKLYGHMVSYSMVLLVVNHFQRNKLLPSIKELQPVEENCVKIGPWLATFMPKTATELKIKVLEPNRGELKRQLHSFFSYYKELNFDQHIVCPYLGNVIEYRELNSHPHMKRYMEYLYKMDTFDAQFRKHSMHIQDPMQLNHNVTKAVTPRETEYFKMCCEHASIFLAIL